MILVDRSVKLGDRLVIGTNTGYVTKVTSRHIIMKGLDNAEILVPNSKFMSDIIINQSYTENTLLMIINIKIKYESNIQLALNLLLDATKDNPYLDPKKPSRVGIDSIEESCIALLLHTWVKNPANGFLEPRTAIYLKIYELFNAHQIKIAIPRQDINLVSVN